jgi:RimJ/RimL family protein N-acetyltransferase
LFLWVNDKEVRRNAFNTNYIAYEEHKKWFNKALSSDDRIIYIAYAENIAIGQIRIDINNDIGLIDFSIAEEFRGKGYGSLLLKEVTRIAKESSNVKELIGRVKLNNIPSQKAFEKAKFKLTNKQDYIEYSYEC